MALKSSKQTAPSPIWSAAACRRFAQRRLSTQIEREACSSIHIAKYSEGVTRPPQTESIRVFGFPKECRYLC